MSIKESEIWAYISKTSETSVKEKVETWINSEDYDSNLYNKINTIYKITIADNSIDLEKQKKRFFKTVQPRKSTNFYIKNVLKYAAVIILLIVSSVLIYQNTLTKIVTIQTEYSELKQVNLPDGSKVWLNSKSKISYKTTTSRTIYLEGEAFFNVVKNKAQPFTVQTSENTIVKVLGTSFNIKAYPKSAYFETTIATGRVELISKNYFEDNLIMLPNDKIKINKRAKKLQHSKIGPKEHISLWRDHKIQFKNQSLKDIAEDFQILYNVKIRIENEEMANSKFTGTFKVTTPIEDILKLLKTTKDFNYKLNEEKNEWVIKK